MEREEGEGRGEGMKKIEGRGGEMRKGIISGSNGARVIDGM